MTCHLRAERLVFWATAATPGGMQLSVELTVSLVWNLKLGVLPGWRLLFASGGVPRNFLRRGARAYRPLRCDDQGVLGLNTWNGRIGGHQALVFARTGDQPAQGETSFVGKQLGRIGIVAAQMWAARSPARRCCILRPQIEEMSWICRAEAQMF